MLAEYVASQCGAQADRYSFGMSLHAAWRVASPELEAAFGRMAAAREADGKPTRRELLFHGAARRGGAGEGGHADGASVTCPRHRLTGTPIENAHAIVAEGFRLPPHGGMFGRGVYFADCPLKSLRYAGGLGGWLRGRRHMLVCEVERSARQHY